MTELLLIALGLVLADPALRRQAQALRPWASAFCCAAGAERVPS